jgi:phenol 2-monooxygenase
VRNASSYGVKRISFAMTDAMIAKYGGKLTEEQAKEEAINSMDPFTLEIESVDWWTLYNYVYPLSLPWRFNTILLYSINHRVADAFFANDRVLLTGDACHTSLEPHRV